MAKNPNNNVWSYVPPHRGAMLDGGSPQSIANDNSVSGGWADRSTLGSSTSGFVYCPEAPYDGNSYTRRDGQWAKLFEGDSFADFGDQIDALEKQVKDLSDRVTELEANFATQDGWDEARVAGIEKLVDDLQKGNVTFEKISAKQEITAYVADPEGGE
jgi:hypothetical protein